MARSLGWRSWQAATAVVVVAVLGCGRGSGGHPSGTPAEVALAACLPPQDPPDGAFFPVPWGRPLRPTLIAHPTVPEIVYAISPEPNPGSTAGPNLFVSADGGRQFCSLKTPLQIQSLWISPADTARLFALAPVPGTINFTLLRSTDAGRTWKMIWPEGPSLVVGVALDRDDPDSAYVLALNISDIFDIALQHTRDAGTTWQEIGPVPNDLRARLGSDELVISGPVVMAGGRFAGDAVYAGYGVHDNDAQAGAPNPDTNVLARFDPQLASWTVLPDAGPLTGEAWSLLATDDRLLMQRADQSLWTSKDRGETWSRLDFDGRQAWQVAGAPSPTFYVQTETALRETDDGGDGWRDVVPISSVDTTFAFAGQPGTFYMRDSTGWGRTADDGATWERHDEPGGMMIAAGTGGRLYVADASTSNFYVSDDAGQSWSGSRLQGTIYGLVADGGDPDRVMVSVGWPPVLLISRDGGRTFDQGILALPHDQAACDRAALNGLDCPAADDPGKDHFVFRQAVPLPNAPGDVILASAEFGVARTTDGGATWSRVYDTEMKKLCPAPGAVYGLGAGEAEAVAPFVSVDDGVSWTPLPDTWSRPDAQPDDFAASARDGTLYVTIDPGLLKSVDRGASWTLVGSHLGGSVYVDPRRPSRVIVDGQLSDDGGATWKEVGIAGGLGSQLAFPANDTLDTYTTSGTFIPPFVYRMTN